MSTTQIQSGYLPQSFKKNVLVRTSLVNQVSNDLWPSIVRKAFPLGLSATLTINRPFASRDLGVLSENEWNKKYGNQVIKRLKLRGMIAESRIVTLFDILAFADFTNTTLNITFTPNNK